MERLVYFCGDVAMVDNLAIEECEEIQEPLKKLHKYENLEEQCHKQNCFSLSHLLDKWECFLDEVHELLEYRRLEEQGLLLRLPCKVGDTVWLANKFFSSEVKCLTIRYIEIVTHITFHTQLENGSWLAFGDYDLFQKVFLTKEEAEQKLESMKGE